MYVNMYSCMYVNILLYTLLSGSMDGCVYATMYIGIWLYVC